MSCDLLLCAVLTAFLSLDFEQHAVHCRFIGFNLLPITANFSDSVRVALQTLYSIPNLTVSDVKMAPSVAVPSTQHPLAGGEGAAVGCCGGSRLPSHNHLNPACTGTAAFWYILGVSDARCPMQDTAAAEGCCRHLRQAQLWLEALIFCSANSWIVWT